MGSLDNGIGKLIRQVFSPLQVTSFRARCDFTSFHRRRIFGPPQKRNTHPALEVNDPRVGAAAPAWPVVCIRIRHHIGKNSTSKLNYQLSVLLSATQKPVNWCRATRTEGTRAAIQADSALGGVQQHQAPVGLRNCARDGSNCEK